MNRPDSFSVDAQALRGKLVWLAWFGLLLFVSCATAVLILKRGPSWNLIAWLVYLAVVVAIFYQPRYGVYALIFFGLFADQSMMNWYPFVKNMSSVESLMYLHSALIFSPLELTLALTLLAWLGGMLMRRKVEIIQGPLFWPALTFISFIAVGIAYGVVTHANLTIALWETRTMFYMPVMLVLVSNLIRNREQVNRLIWLAMTAICLQGIYGIYFFFGVRKGEISRLDSMIEHSAAIRMNTLFVLAVTVWLFHAHPAKRVLLPLMCLPVVLPYVVAQRRAAFMTIGVALVLIGVVLYFVNRPWFWRIAPVAAVAGVLYLGAFWNNQSALGLPARAVKGVLFEDAGNAQENSSSVYRLIENINNMFTIRQKPLTGVGFGNKFYIIMTLPDISFFAWWEYIVHNSIMWIWMKGGFGAYFSMLLLIGSALINGVRVFWRMPGNDLSAIALTAGLYVVMHFIYAYVDMSWDTLSMLYLGVMFGLINVLELIVAQPVPIAARRYPWQPEPLPAPGLRPLAGTGTK